MLVARSQKSGLLGFEEHAGHLNSDFGLAVSAIGDLHSFKVDASRLDFGGISTCRFQISPTKYCRTLETLSRPSPKASYAFHILDPIVAHFCQNGRHAEMTSGGMAIMDTRITGYYCFPEPASGTILVIPTDHWEDLAPAPHPDSPYVLDSQRTSARLARNLCLELAHSGSGLPEQYRATVVRQLIELLSLAISDSSETLPDTLHRQMRVQQIKAFIRNNLADPNLGPSHIADHFGISTRLVSSVFSKQDFSVMDYIWEMRLARSAELLSQNERSVLSIKTISYMVGFKLPSHFTTAFRKKYGRTPSEYRKR